MKVRHRVGYDALAISCKLWFGGT